MLSKFKQHRSPAAAILIAAIVFALVVLAGRRGHLEGAELNAYDFSLRRLPRDQRQANAVVIVGIDEVDIRAMGHYPVCDLELAELLRRLLDWGAVAVGLDLARDVPVPCTQGDNGIARLDAVLRNNKNLICAQVLGDLEDRTAAVEPPPALRESPEQVGFADFRRDKDGALRRAFYSADADPRPDQENKVYSVAFRLACWMLAQDDRDDPDVALEQKLGMLKQRHGGYASADINPADNSQFMIDFRAPPSELKTFQLRQALPDHLRLGPKDAPARLRDITPADVKGKIVIVGVNAKHSVKDVFNTPLSNGLYGVELHAHVVDQFLRLVRNDARPLRSWPEWAEWLLALACSVAGLALAWWTRSAWKYTAGVLITLGLIWLAAYLALRNNLWLPVIRPWAAFAAPSLAVALYVRGLEHWQRKVIGNIFNRSVNTAIADELMRRGDEILAHGRLAPDERYATVLFTDLRGFTRLSEGMSPRRLIEWLDPYMEQLSTAVTDRGGMIVKYTGDGMMVVFGVPIYGQTEADYDAHALAAVQCALDMRARFAQFVARHAPNLDPPLMMRVGIHSGMVVVGSVGNAQRLEFVTLGDTVNTASRLESMEKDMMHPQITGGGCRILIGESTFRRVQQHVDAQCVGDFTLVGKQQKIAVYGVVGPKTAPRETSRPLAAAAPLLLAALIGLVAATPCFAQDPKPAASTQTPQPAAQPQSQPAQNVKAPKWGSRKKAPPPPGGQSIGGIARSEGDQTALFIFAPNTGGFTTRKLPVIYWLNTRPTDRPITFTLVNDKTDETVLKTTLNGKEAGLHMLDLADLAKKLNKDVSLEPAQWSPGDPPQKLAPQYKLGIGIHDEKNADTADWTFAQTTIVRIPAPDNAQTPPLDELVETGIWFDAADTLFRSLATQPDSPTLRSVLDEMIKAENVFEYQVPPRLDTPEKEKERGRAPELLRNSPIPLELRAPK